MKNKITFFQAQKWAFSFVASQGKEKSAVNMLLEGQMGWDLTSLLMHYRDLMPQDEWEKFQQNVKLYCEDWPPQYLLGKADFYGLTFKVAPGVLIPRLETEELVEWILNEYPNQKMSVLDLGTGSGAIGISLKANRPDWKVTLSDISADALKIARENAELLEQNVKIVKSDLFEQISDKYDLIVSNPPYISFDEKKLMDKSVLEHEPQQALFAQDEGLWFYREIASQAEDYLNPHGSIFLEIGFHQGQKVKQIFKGKFPYDEVLLCQDIDGHDRMVRLKK